MPTEADTTTKEYLCDHLGWPLTAGCRRHKPIGILLSYAGKHKHLGDKATVGDHIHVSLRVLLDETSRHAPLRLTAAHLAALELAVCMIEETPPELISKAQQAWERKEQRR
jgi:hypothetical protein